MAIDQSCHRPYVIRAIKQQMIPSAEIHNMPHTNPIKDKIPEMIYSSHDTVSWFLMSHLTCSYHNGQNQDVFDCFQ